MKKIFSSETTRPRALIFNMERHLEDIYQVCANYAPGAKNGPAPGVTCLTQAYIGKNIKKFLSEIIRPRALIL